VQLIGDGPQRSELEAMIVDKHLECISVTGYLSGSDLEQSLRDVCVVVMPSVWEETAGLSAMEHMMRGKVVLASQVGGLGEIVGDSGMLFPTGDAVAMGRLHEDAAAGPFINCVDWQAST
jgi:glycosyltransferase involved in cell wall biosynthesis